MTSRRIKSNAGFSIASVLVAFALIGGLGVMIAKMMGSAQKGGLAVQNRMALGNVESWVKLMSLQGERCKDSFKDAAGNPIIYQGNDLPFQQIVLGSQKLSVGETHEGLRITEMAIGPFFGPEPLPLEEGLYAMALTIKAKPTRESFGAQNFETRLPMMLNIGAVGDVVSCASGTAILSPKQVCESLGMAFDEDNKTCGILGQGCPNDGELVRGFEPDGTMICEVPSGEPGPGGGGGDDESKLARIYYSWTKSFNANGSKKACLTKSPTSCQVIGGVTANTGMSRNDLCSLKGENRLIGQTPPPSKCPAGYKSVRVETCENRDGITETKPKNKMSSNVVKRMRVCRKD